MKLDRHRTEIQMAKKSLLQNTLAVKAGLSHGVVNQAVNGKNVSTRAVGKICTALECQPEDIIKEGE